MLTVTESAGAHLSSLLVEAEAPEKVAIRFVREGDGFALDLDNPRDGDTTFAHQERTVLVLDDEVSKLMADLTLDVKDSDAGPKLTLR
jgi:hypothetical protein